MRSRTEEGDILLSVRTLCSKSHLHDRIVWTEEFCCLLSFTIIHVCVNNEFAFVMGLFVRIPRIYFRYIKKSTNKNSIYIVTFNFSFWK